MWWGARRLAALPLVLFLSMLPTVRVQQDIDFEESFLVGFKSMVPTLGQLPMRSAQNDSDAGVDLRSWWTGLVEQAEDAASRGAYFEAIYNFQLIFSTCCGTVGQIRKCQMDDSSGYRIRMLLGSVLRDAALPNLAEIMYQEAFVLSQTQGRASDSHDVNFQMALLASQRGQLQSAIMYYKNALFSDSRNESSLVNLGSLLIADGKINDGLHYFQKALSLRKRKVHHTVYSNDTVTKFLTGTIVWSLAQLCL